MIKFFRSLYLSSRFFQISGGLIVASIAAYFMPFLFPAVKAGIMLAAGMAVVDIGMLYRNKNGLVATRKTPERLSNGDQNEIELQLENRYAFSTRCEVIDEVPEQFQLRDLQFDLSVQARAQRNIKYLLRPTTRGEYKFGSLNIYVHSPFELIKRRYEFEVEEKMVPTYPSYLQMRKYELLAISNKLTEVGVKKVRRLGHTTEFEQIKEYVRGDDYRTVNWSASARSNKLMVNQYTDEKSQNLYCIIDKSRSMKMPFNGMTLLDYAINTALVMSNIAILKKDKAGLITFSDKVSAVVPADNKAIQMNYIMNALYNQTTQFQEADFARLHILIKRKLNQRSLLVLFTNFESLNSMKRQLPYLRSLSKNHLVMVVFFENTELKALVKSRPKTTEEIYTKAIGENFVFEKKQIVKELEQNGIISILTTPENLTIATVNKYLELKARRMI